MNHVLDLIGSTIIAGFIILILLRLNSQIGDAATQMHEQTFNQRNAVSVGDILEHDFAKIGYRVSIGEKIIQADSNAIIFRADIDNNGVVDTINYTLTTPDSMNSTPNPNDKKLKRKVNSAISRIAGVVREFNLVYYDSLNVQINYGSLSSAVNRSKIRGIRVYTKFELPFLVNDSYNPTELRRVYRPKNLR
ncbi:MAG: hypothetical protein FD143_2409 [Ignavibacteria bacterium]|nr:MAG: hypothetical protein FD143_2409 [Ignavibacteria bacterium]KAF0157174.1 MAG: hypothetical protein FD188_2815 [Ignavibacteria bacterium]